MTYNHWPSELIEGSQGWLVLCSSHGIYVDEIFMITFDSMDDYWHIRLFDSVSSFHHKATRLIGEFIVP